jgi:membrane protease YdiL (CAAX protease family)
MPLEPCSHCGCENAGDAVFCKECGTVLIVPESTAKPIPLDPDKQVVGDSSLELKCCAYCGRENEGRAVYCTECGTPFPSAAVEPESSQVAPDDMVLTAGRATTILLVYLLAQFGGAVVGGVLGAIQSGADGQTVRDPHRLKDAMMGPAVFLAVIAGGVGMWLMSRSLVRRGLYDQSSTGAAWIPGTSKQIAQGLCVGMILGSIYVLMAPFLQDQVSKTGAGPIARMAVTPGSARIYWVIMALFLAPMIEELLFRGVLYGGYRKALGPTGAAVLTTSLFVLLHLTEMIHFWPSIIFITGLASAALWLRLRSSAIGSAVAAHFGYNAILAAWIVRASW